MNPLLQQSITELKRIDPYLLICFLSTPIEIDLTIKTACTNGLIVRWNTEYFKDKGILYGAFVLAHEFMHICLRHPQRLKPWMDREVANIAADHVVNLLLKKCGWTVPPNLYCDDKYAGWSFEAVYADLMKQKAQQGPPPPPPPVPTNPGAQSELDEDAEEDGDGEEEDKESTSWDDREEEVYSDEDAKQRGLPGTEEEEEGEGKGKGEKEERDDADGEGQGEGKGEGEGTPAPGEGEGGSGQPGQGEPADPFKKVYYEAPGEFEPMPETDAAKAGQKAINEILQDNAVKSMMRGKVGAGWIAKVTGDPEPEVPWQAHVEKHLDELAHTRMSFNPGHPQYQGGDVLMPRLSGRQLDTVVLVSDSSGSVEAAAFAVYIRETMALLDLFDIKRVLILHNDAEVQKVSDSAAGEAPLDMRYGNGGTSFIPAFDWVEEHQVTPSLLIFFTDAYGLYPSTPPSYPVLWMVSGAAQHLQPGQMYYPPFGEMIGLHV